MTKPEAGRSAADIKQGAKALAGASKSFLAALAAAK